MEILSAILIMALGGASLPGLYDSTNTSAFARFDVNGQTVAIGEREPKDKTDVEVKDFFKIYEHPGGPVVMELYAMKETADHTLNFGYADMALERKG